MSDHDFNVTIVDDDAAVLKAIERLVRSMGWKVMTFLSPDEFLEAYDPRQMGCLIIDMAMPGLSGLELQRILREKRATPPIIFLSATNQIPDIIRAMKQGAIDFLIKPVDESVLLKAIRAAFEQESVARQARVELINMETRLQSLTSREREVFEHVVAGELNKQIAADLGIVESTIKVHRARVMEKMGAGSLAELVQFAQRLGIQQ